MSDPAAAVSAYIGLGANLADPRRQVEQALVELAALPQTRLAAASRLYRTTPVGPQDQPDYVNAAARLSTRLTPQALLRALQQIECRHGRVRDGTRWGPRTLDLDLLLYADLVLDAPNLCLPHAEMHRRAFVLVPLADVAPARLLIPGHGPLAALLAGLERDGIIPLPAAVAAGQPPRVALS